MKVIFIYDINGNKCEVENDNNVIIPNDTYRIGLYCNVYGTMNYIIQINDQIFKFYLQTGEGITICNDKQYFHDRGYIGKRVGSNTHKNFLIGEETLNETIKMNKGDNIKITYNFLSNDITNLPDPIHSGSCVFKIV